MSRIRLLVSGEMKGADDDERAGCDVLRDVDSLTEIEVEGVWYRVEDLDRRDLVRVLLQWVAGQSVLEYKAESAVPLFFFVRRKGSVARKAESPLSSKG